MIEKELKIRDFCGDYALDIPSVEVQNGDGYYDEFGNYVSFEKE